MPVNYIMYNSEAKMLKIKFIYIPFNLNKYRYLIYIYNWKITFKLNNKNNTKLINSFNIY